MDLRAVNPKISSDGKKIVYTIDGDGTLNIGVCDADGKNIIPLDKLSKWRTGLYTRMVKGW